MPGILFNDRDTRYSRRRLVGSALALAGGAAFGRGALAQDDPDVVPIQSTELGPMPGTVVLVFVFLAAFVVYFFVNWKILSFLWRIG